MTTLTVGELGRIYASAELRRLHGVRVTVCGVSRGYARGRAIPHDPRERQPSGLDFSRAGYGLYLNGVRVMAIEWAHDALLESEPYYAPVTRDTVLEVGPPAPRRRVSKKAKLRQVLNRRRRGVK